MAADDRGSVGSGGGTACDVTAPEIASTVFVTRGVGDSCEAEFFDGSTGAGGGSGALFGSALATSIGGSAEGADGPGRAASTGAGGGSGFTTSVGAGGPGGGSRLTTSAGAGGAGGGS
jgi:hypothetical protein